MTIYILVALAFLTHLGYAGSRLVVPLFAVEQGATPFVVGTVAALYAALPLFLALPAGRAADRIGFKILLVSGTSGVCLGLVIVCIRPSLEMLYVSAALQGVAFMALQLGTQTLAGAIAGPADRARNFSLVSLGFAIANFAGPLMTGILIDQIGYVLTFGALALPLVPAIVLSAMGSRWLPATAHVKTAAASGGMFDLLRIKPLRDTLIASAVISGGWDVYQFFMPIYGHSQNISATAIGIIMSAFAIAIILVRVFLPFVLRHMGEAELMTYSMFVACFAFALMPVFSSVWPLAIVSFVLGLGCGCGQPLSMTLLFNATPKGRGGEITGMRITANQVMHTVVPLFFGAIGSAAGYAAVFLVNAACLAGGGWLTGRNQAKNK